MKSFATLFDAAVKASDVIKYEDISAQNLKDLFVLSGYIDDACKLNSARLKRVEIISDDRFAVVMEFDYIAIQYKDNDPFKRVLEFSECFELALTEDKAFRMKVIFPLERKESFDG